MHVDGHLDLASNVTVHERDLTRGLLAQRRREQRERQELMVTLPELRRGDVGIVFATLFTLPADMNRPDGAPPLTEWQQSVCYSSPDEAHALATEQLEVYERWEEEDRVRILRSRADLDEHVAAWAEGDRTVGLVLLMEGADPIRTPEELGDWVDRGVRLVGPAWQQTRYSGGTSDPGPLTDLGTELVRRMIDRGVALDASHLAEESFWDAMALEPDLVCASHSNARAVTAGDRHLTDDMIREIGRRDGVVGLVLGDDFLRPTALAGDAPEPSPPRNDDGEDNRGSDEDSDAHTESTEPPEPVTLADVQRHAEHVAGLIGWNRVAIGSDFDGGFGRQETPQELTRAADFSKLAAIAPPEHRDAVLRDNWLGFLRRALRRW
jgi:membrane dipeptidase